MRTNTHTAPTATAQADGQGLTSPNDKKAGGENPT